MGLMRHADAHTRGYHLSESVFGPYAVRSFESSVVISCGRCVWFRWEAR